MQIRLEDLRLSSQLEFCLSSVFQSRLSICIDPFTEHLDAYGLQLAMGDLPAVQVDFVNWAKVFSKDLNEVDAKAKAVHKLYVQYCTVH